MPQVTEMLNKIGLSEIAFLAKSEAGLTNLVATGVLGHENLKIPIIVKIREKAKESRERAMGGWVVNPLQNEARLLKLMSEGGVNVPKVIDYRLGSFGEILVLQKMEGESCYKLRSSLSEMELESLEVKKGSLLAEIQNVAVGGLNYGPVSKGSGEYGSWSEYFGLKVKVTLAHLKGRYSELCSLSHFGRLGVDEEGWNSLLRDIERIYGAKEIKRLLDLDDTPTVAHGDYWDGNLLAEKKNGAWNVNAIDWERGDISGKSFDLALWLAWKVGGTEFEPRLMSRRFLEGFRVHGGMISSDINKYIAIYGLWQYLDFLLIDLVYGIDRSKESVFEISKLWRQIGGLV